MESPFILKIFNEEELAPEWRICVNFIFGDGEENYIKYVITPEEMEMIIKADKWIVIDNIHINKQTLQSFIFFTEIKTVEGKWILYSEKAATEILKQELQMELAAKNVLDTQKHVLDEMFTKLLNKGA